MPVNQMQFQCVNINDKIRKINIAYRKFIRGDAIL